MTPTGLSRALCQTCKDPSQAQIALDMSPQSLQDAIFHQHFLIESFLYTLRSHEELSPYRLLPEEHPRRCNEVAVRMVMDTTGETNQTMKDVLHFTVGNVYDNLMRRVQCIYWTLSSPKKERKRRGRREREKRKNNNKKNIERSERCVETMQEIMNKVKVMSSQKSDDSASKLKSKLKMLVSARESELQAWQNLEEKYPSSSLTSFLQEFKSESFDAGMLHNSLGLLSHFPPLVSYFDLLPPLSSLPQSIALSRK